MLDYDSAFDPDVQAIARGDAESALAGRLADNLGTLFSGWGEEASNEVYRSLLAALGQGDHPSVAARNIERDLLTTIGGMTRNRAMVIARTEMLGAYRDTQLNNYRANSDVVQQWMWSAADGACPVCSDLDGDTFDLDESQSSHPGCRCACLPVTRSYDDILSGFGIDTSEMDLPDDTSITSSYVPMRDRFAEMSAAEQDAILGKAAGALYRNGDLQLSDLVGQTDDGQYYQKSLKELGYTRDDLQAALNQDAYNAMQATASDGVAAAEAATTVEQTAAEAAAAGAASAASAASSAGVDGTADLQQMFDGYRPDDYGASLDALTDPLADNADFQSLYDVLGLTTPDQLDLLAAVAEEEGTTVAEEQARFAVNALIQEYHLYADASSSARPLQIALQEAANAEFGLTGAASFYTEAQRAAALAEYGDVLPGLQAFLRQMYDNTQAWFAEHGISEITVYRGMRWAEGDQPVGFAYDGTSIQQDVTLQPISSFSINQGLAADYASGGDYGMLVSDTVPVEEILSTGFTGFGDARNMAEVLLLGGIRDMLATAMMEGA